MSAEEKAAILEKVEAQPGSRRKILAELRVSKSTYYRWRTRQSQGRFEDRSSGIRSWNALTPEEESQVLEVAMEHTDRQNQPKIVEECTLPLTGKGCVSLIVTDLAVMQPTEQGLVLKEVAPGWTPEEVQELTGARLILAPDLKEYEL